MPNSKFERLLAKNSPFLTRGHDFVDIGGVKWATCNVGAEKPTDMGLYFAWGETKGYTADEVRQGKRLFNWKDYQLITFGNLSKYNEYDRKTGLDKIDDPVAINWGGRWRLPTADEFAALRNAVNTELVKDYQGSGVAGFVCTDKTDSSKVLFFPAAGYCINDSVSGVSGCGYYWSSYLYSPFHVRSAYCLYFCMYGMGSVSDYRHYGFSVRGVVDENSINSAKLR